MIQGAFADPSGPLLRGVKDRQQQRPSPDSRIPNPVENGVDRFAFFGRCDRARDQVQVHSESLIRIADALNSAVPDLRSVASIVSRLVSTSSGSAWS